MKAETIIDVVIKDKDGNDMPLKVKRLTQKRISELRDIYTTKKPAYDKNGNPLVMNGRIVWSEDRDVESYSRMLLVESLVEPQLDDPELMEFVGIDDVVDMPGAVFTPDEIRQISDITGNLVSFRSLEDVKKEDIEEAKN